MSLGLLAVVLVPAVHFGMIWREGYVPELTTQRTNLTLATTFLVGTLFALRQLHVLRRVEESAHLELQARQRLLRAERMSAIGMLVAGVAHEINNPLTGILGQAELLARRSTDERTRSGLQVIHENAERCARIVRNLLIFARGSQSERGIVSLSELVRQVLDLENHDLRLRGIDVSLDLNSDARVYGDGGQLQQVLVNLFNNAVHAIGQRPGAHRLRIAAAPVAKDRVRLEVHDDGPGIPSHLRDEVFKPLFTTKPQGEGTGLGLAICQDIVTGHGGTIALVDPSGGGALFRIELPVNAPAATAPGPPPEPPLMSLAGARVLVVDDEESVRELIAEILVDAGCAVESSASAEEAVSALGRGFDVVVCDLRMPGIGGAGLHLRTVEESPALRHRFVFVTGDTADPDTWSFLNASGCETVEKPFATKALLEAVARTLARS
jgi:two-component system NtrC family sensor kinase